ncbi:MAG TPA: hypothetical protein VGO93_07410 [Candidatus Xenobia bacterium]
MLFAHHDFSTRGQGATDQERVVRPLAQRAGPLHCDTGALPVAIVLAGLALVEARRRQ